MAYQDNGHELDWNSAIENDAPEYVVLPAGDYDFQVVELERTRHAGSAKLPPCNKAVVHIRISDGNGVSVIRHNLFLHSRCEGLLCDFFAGIGQRQKGERRAMDWSRVVGAQGRAKVGIRTYSKDGRDYQANEIKKFYPGEPAPTAAAPGEPYLSKEPPYDDEVF